MSQQLVSTGIAPVVRRFTHALAETFFATTRHDTKLRGRGSVARRNAGNRTSEVVWGVVLFALAFATLLWLHVHFGVPVSFE